MRGVRTVRRPSATHSGHWNPTDAGTMQSGQIGLPQLEQDTPVSTFGWLAHVTGAATPGSTLDTAFECSIRTVLQELRAGAA